MRMSTNVPAQKVIAASLGAALAQLIVHAISVYAPDVPVPPEVQAALTVVLTFAAGYLTPPAGRDTVVDESADKGAQP